MKTALITGASSGLGEELAKLLAAEGWALILVARRVERMEKLAAGLGVPVKIIGADLGTRAGLETVFSLTADDRVDLLVNNAGFGSSGEFTKSDPDRDLQMIDVNCKALHALMRHFLPRMTQRDSGTVLNIASIAGFLTGPMMATYYATKSYVLTLTKSVAGELKHAGSKVQVCAICPGPFDTEFNSVADVKFNLPGMDCKTVAEAALRGIKRKKTVIYPGAAVKLAKFGVRLAPDALVARICLAMQLKKQ